MNDVNSQAPADAAATVDARNPWLGLASFTEETRAYFFGRDEEVAELARRVQRKLLTVLFGQSGLGKTSILRAGLVPRLRGHGYCPIYVRIDYSRDAPEPAVQIKQAIQVYARRAGQWTQVGVAVEGESLWEFLHHRDDVLRDESGATLIPLLIFDQFEEIFTLAQNDDFGRARAAHFVAELADLVENRPPKEFEARLEQDESAAERFDFARSDYRVLIALREDYLAPLESLKQAMPSISQNRVRLAPMTGTQALAAVIEPGRKLVSDEVAAAIVRFVAGGSELSNAVVEPSLLSLICRELNDARLAQARSEISLDLLAGSHATILSNFYERALVDQPPAVRRIIEDDLLTASGFRESVAEESLVGRFTEAGGAANTLATLVNRRLLRIEERLDVRRVELTHDVLCSVVKASRDRRQEREAREATERLLAEQRARELAAHRAAVRARGIAGGCAVLAVLAIVAAVYGYISSGRAQHAEHEAQQTRALAEQARGHAEDLLGYLSDDFGSELESFGRLDVLAEFSQRQIDYFHALPPVLRGKESIRNGVLALVHHGTALRTLGNVPRASVDATEAFRLLQQLRDGGDTSEATTIALARTELLEGRILESHKDPGTLAMFQRADDLLRPLAEAPKASVAVRRAYLEALVRTGYEQLSVNLYEDAVRDEREAQRMAADMGAINVSNLDMGAWYAEGAAWLVEALDSLGRYDEAVRAGEDADAVAGRVLERRPGYRLALHAQQVIESALSGVAQDELNPTEGVRFAERAEQVSLTLLKLDPANVVSSNNLGAARGAASGALWHGGRLHEAIAYELKAMQDFGQATPGGGTYFYNRDGAMAFSAFMQNAVGDHAGAEVTAGTGAPYLAKLRQREPGASDLIALLEAVGKLVAATGAYTRDDLGTARHLTAAALTQLQGQTPHGAVVSGYHFVSYIGFHLAARTAYRLGDFAAAEQAERSALPERQAAGTKALDDQRELGEVSTWLAMAEARQGRTAEAAQTIAPVVTLERGLAARNHGDAWVPQELAAALYAEALAEPAKRAALLRESGALLDGLAPEVRATHDVRLWRTWVRQAAQNP
jgi:tetratricopeptide (TPR) repeat protein